MDGTNGRGRPRALAALLLLLALTACLYLARLEAHTGADIVLPRDYHAPAEGADADVLDAFYEGYVHQEGRPYTIREDLLLSRLACIEAPRGFRGEAGGVTLQALCEEIARILADETVDAEAVFGRGRPELLGILAGIGEHPRLGALTIRDYLATGSGLAGYVLSRDDELTIALRGTDDALDMLDNVLLLPFNLSIQYADMRALLAAYPGASRIWLTGHSKGGHNALYAASIDPRCRATAFNAPGFGILLSDAQHDGLDAGVNYVINGDVTGFLLFHLERRVVLESPASAAADRLTLRGRHRLDFFFSVDDLAVANRIQPLGIWAEWITQVAWLLLVLLAACGLPRGIWRLWRGLRGRFG